MEATTSLLRYKCWWTFVFILWASSLQIGIYSYCSRYSLTTIAVPDVGGACISLAFGFSVMPVVALGLLVILVMKLGADEVHVVATAFY